MGFYPPTSSILDSEGQINGSVIGGVETIVAATSLNSGVQLVGEHITATGTAASATGGTDSLFSSTYASAGTTNSVAGLSGTYAQYQGQFMLRQRSVVALFSIAAIRSFFGFSNQTGATAVGSDDPAGHYAGFQFSTNRGDTNWQCVTKDGTTQKVTNSGVPASTAAFQFEIYLTPTKAEFRINGLVVATHLTNLPDSTNNIRQVFHWATLENVSKIGLFTFSRVRIERI